MKLKTIFKKRFLLSVILSVLLIFSLAVLIITQIIPNQKYFFQFLQKSLKGESSSAEVFVDNGRLTFKFKIVKKDELNTGQFAQNLGIKNSVFENFSLELDKNSLDKIGPILPVKVDLDITPKRIWFSNTGLNPLKSGLSKTTYNFATRSGKLDLKVNSPQDFDMQIIDPKVILEDATSSGKINLTSKSYAMFPILAKIDRIELRVNGRNVSGEIMLK